MIGFVGGAASQFYLQWLPNDVDPDALWTCAQFEATLCTIEAFVDGRGAQMAAVFPVAWGVPRVLASIVLKEASRTLSTHLEQFGAGTPRHESNASELRKMKLIAREFETVCAQRYPTPQQAIRVDDADWEAKLDGMLSSLFESIVPSGKGGGGAAEGLMNVTRFELGDLFGEETVRYACDCSSLSLCTRSLGLLHVDNRSLLSLYRVSFTSLPGLFYLYLRSLLTLLHTSGLSWGIWKRPLWERHDLFGALLQDLEWGVRGST